jgi:hypothetical protein
MKRPLYLLKSENFFRSMKILDGWKMHEIGLGSREIKCNSAHGCGRKRVISPQRERFGPSLGSGRRTSSSVTSFLL